MFQLKKPIMKELPTREKWDVISDRVLADIEGREWRTVPAQHRPDGEVQIPEEFDPERWDGMS